MQIRYAAQLYYVVSCLCFLNKKQGSYTDDSFESPDKHDLWCSSNVFIVW